ncbi:MAG: cyclase family protein [bacterium]
MSKIIWLSHELAEDTPAYGGGESLKIDRLTSIAAGDTANTVRLTLPNHLGTHVDTPYHFAEDVPTLSDFPAEFWVFDRPVLIDVPGEEGHLIEPGDVAGHIPEGTDLLLLRTGFEKYRGEEVYWARNPGIAPSLGGWLREHYPTVRALGMDVISVTSSLHRMEGREAHRGLLDPNRPGHPILAIEDMALAEVDGRLARVVVSPLRLRRGDGGPCTVIGFT